MERQPGSRDNGLNAERYVVLADLPPAAAESLLGDLAAAGIAAYLQQGDDMVRVWVDARAETGARVLLPASAAPAAPLDEDAAWQAIVAQLTEPASASALASWPDAEDVAAAPRVLRRADDFVAAPINLDAEEHFVPPPPPPAPRLHPVTILALALMGVGVALLVVPTVLSGSVSGGTSLLALAAILSGFGVLVYRMKDGPPSDDDDGAVL